MGSLLKLGGPKSKFEFNKPITSLYLQKETVCPEYNNCDLKWKTNDDS